MQTNIRIGQYDEEKTDVLKCNHCKIDHPVEPSYKKMFLIETKKKIDRIREYHDDIGFIEPEDAWTCGRCMLVIHGLPPDAMRTDCPDHEVPISSDQQQDG